MQEINIHPCISELLFPAHNFDLVCKTLMQLGKFAGLCQQLAAIGIMPSLEKGGNTLKQLVQAVVGVTRRLGRGVPLLTTSGSVSPSL